MRCMRYEWPDPKDARKAFRVEGGRLTLLDGVGDIYDGPGEEILCPEILRLAEEVERLKAEAAFAPDRVLEAVRLGERARIRRELIAELEAWTKGAALSSFRADVASSLLAALNRICPGEG